MKACLSKLLLVMSKFAQLSAEFLGTLLLVCSVVGSGYMAQELFPGSPGNMLLANTLVTGVMLVVLINIFGQFSGAHFNPAVSISFYLMKTMTLGKFLQYSIVQILGGISGSLLANIMFTEQWLQVSSIQREGSNLFISEIVASFGLVLTILALVNKKETINLGAAVGLYIAGAYWFTSSTSFANPAVTIGRIFTSNFTGIDPINVGYFVVAQFIGASLAFFLMRFYNKNS